MENQNQEKDELDTILKVASFCAPIVGLILWGMNKDKLPTKAKSAVTAAIAGIVFYVIINIIMQVAVRAI